MADQLRLNFWSEPRGVIQVSASAGAGKTYRLAVQFLRVLASLGPPQEAHLASVVALTFTNQAAAEMRERILLFLKHIALSTETGRRLSEETGLSPREAEGWLETIFSAYQAFQVRTIDSLLFTLIRGLAWELGLRPDLSAEIREEHFLNQAFDRLLFRLREDPRLRGLFEEALETFLELEARGGFNPEPHFRRRMVALHRLLRRLTPGKNGPPPSREALAALEEELRSLGEELSRRLFEDLGAEPAYPRWEEYLRDPLRYVWSKVFQKESLRQLVRKGSLPRGVELPEDLYLRLRERLGLYLRLKARAEVAPYERLFAEIVRELSEVREEEGVLQAGSWTELLALYARQYLPLIYLKLGTRLRHFLIDEFQDTDRRQWEALQPLVEEVVATGGSFFYVGDVKQAIYMWRGGDPELFFEVLTQLPAELQAESLPWNRRSARRIVTFNNLLFSRLRENLPQIVARLLHGRTEALRLRDCEVTEALCARLREVYEEVEQVPEEGAPEGGVYLREISSSDQDKEAFREEVFQGLRELMPGLYRRFVEGGRTLALLVRENREAEELAAFLFGMGLPALTERALRLENSPLIKGLLSLLRYLDYPGDETALAGFLASPLTSSGPEILQRYLRQGAGPSLAEFLSSEAPGLHRKLSELSENLHRRTLYETVQAAVKKFGLFERFPEARLYLMRFLSAVLAYEEEALSLSEFLARWEELGVEEKVGLPREIQAVRVFTIHAAKGLEFDAVVLPLLTWGPRGRVELVAGEEGLLRVRKEAPEDLRRIYLEEKAREVFESLNLLYVALTRAREELHLFVPKKTRYYTVASVLQDLAVTQILEGLSE
ncbi:AAA family ATPase [Thermosulfurimonas marina]|uniref:DNA 3'-5' helicase n=1 Tax=Thermosulfurimonas marina TaxID=2047767 RepID=A0A6H1WTS7_9BACT|nr:UvrD-helicase domain-containing protein [Thermosulfurimonas marina]QJA06588.1 AAA family ATPase [Thermosulfurimonas marina]